VSNSAWGPKIKRIRNNSQPDYVFLRYTRETWDVSELFWIPGHWLTEKAIERRKPLKKTARRSGWVGSNILLNEIPKEGKLWLIHPGGVVPKKLVREQYSKFNFMQEMESDNRGWLASVLSCIEKLNLKRGQNFTLVKMYEFEKYLSKQWPKNRHIKAKIRQQLQILRDKGVIKFLGHGKYRLL
jgi:type II restriction enzyme